MGNISQEVILIAVSSAFFLLVGIGIVMLILTYQKRKLKYFREKELMKSSYEKEILQTQLEIQEQTLKTISEEIHDNIGQALSLAKLNLNTMPEVNDEAVKQKIITTKELVSKAIVDLRDLSKSLNTDYVVNMGLQRAVEYELELIEKSTGIKTNLVIEGLAFRLEKQNELILFRIVQEVLNNIVKHAGASTVFAVICYLPTSLELKISDDGKGVNLQPLNEGTINTFGLGIRNMHNRAKLIGADFKMNSTIGKGTTIKINLPVSIISNG